VLESKEMSGGEREGGEPKPRSEAVMRLALQHAASVRDLAAAVNETSSAWFMRTDVVRCKGTLTWSRASTRDAHVPENNGAPAANGWRGAGGGPREPPLPGDNNE